MASRRLPAAHLALYSRSSSEEGIIIDAEPVKGTGYHAYPEDLQPMTVDVARTIHQPHCRDLDPRVYPWMMQLEVEIGSST